MNKLPKHLLSIDVFRAITMLFMIFVNDLSSVKDIPTWIEHVDANADGLGFADTVFPAFLFIVGLSLPFAIRNRINKGKNDTSIFGYIITRAAALLIMGFLHVNGENYSSAALLPHSVWTLLITIGFFLIWLDYPSALTKAKKYTLIATGFFLLLLMALLFKGGDALHPEGLKPHWWGILGIIGWAYLVCASIFLLTKGKFSLLLAAFIGLVFINIATHTGHLKFSIWVIGDGSSASLVMAGVLITSIYEKMAGAGKDLYLWVIFITSALIMILAGLVIRPYAGGISKIHSTPAWVFICIGINTLVFAALVYLVDLKGKQNWFSFIRPGGTSTLTCYLLPYILYSIFSILNFQYPKIFNEGAGGILRSFAFSLLVIWLVGILEKYKLRLKI